MKPRARTLVHSLVLLLGMPGLTCSWVRAADLPGLILENLTPAEGMPQATVMATLQDSQGYVWLGTEDGLVRYDGHELVRYGYSRNAKNGLPGNFIYEIVEDHNSDLWVATKDTGLARWNRATDDFTVFRHDLADPQSLSSDSTRSVFVDRQNRIWVGTSGAGIAVLDPRSGHFKSLRHDSAINGSLSSDLIYHVTAGANGSIRAATSLGLDEWQPERGEFIHRYRGEVTSHSSGGSEVSQAIDDPSGGLWIGTFDGGLDRLNADGTVRHAYRHDPGDPTSLVNDEVHALLRDRMGHLWVGTADGLDLFNPNSGTFTHYRHDGSDASSLQDSYVMSLYEDATGLVWIGTRAGGVGRWNPRSWELGGHRPPWLDAKLVTSFADAGDHKVWIGSLGAGLVQFDDVNGEAVGIDTLLRRKNALGDSRVMSLQSDRHGTLWIGTMGSGLKKLTRNGELIGIPVKAGDPRGISAAGIMTLFESERGDIWIGTHGGGANILNPATDEVKQLPIWSGVPQFSGSDSITSIAEDRAGFIWLGTDGGGLELAKPDGTILKVFTHDPADPASIPSNTIYSVTVDSRNVVWVGTDQSGLARVKGSPQQVEAIQFQTISREDGLSSDTIYAVLEDSAGHLWISGNAGLMRYDPATRAVKTFHREHGVQGEEFDLNAYHRLADGRLCFGGPGGFNIFDPSRLTETTRAPRVVLTRLEVLGAPVATSKPYWLMDRIDLDYQASIVSLDFGELDFTSPKRNRLAYRVAGLSERWIDLGTQHRITLTNLDAGEHVLEVRAANADSVWSDPPSRLVLHRDPAPWRSPWAYLAYALVSILLITWKWRESRAKLQAIVAAKENLAVEVAVRTGELVESNRRLAEASNAKSQFLARMSHELRTPMNGVVGSSELLARTTQSGAQRRLTDTIRSSAKVMLQIVNDLLDLSKLEVEKVKFENLPFDLLQVVEESALLFAAAAAAKNVALTIIPPARDVSGLSGDALRIRQILMNLIGNAVKFTAAGDIIVTADCAVSDLGRAELSFSIADTGIGMDAPTLLRVFEPFTQADESMSRRFGGSGLGLAICRELAQQMGGGIRAESRLESGSTFYVTIPVGLAAADRAEAPRAGASSPALRILTRHNPLRDSLVRHATACGLKVSEDFVQPEDVGGFEDVLIVDWETHEEFILAALQGNPTFKRVPIIVAPTFEVDRLASLLIKHRTHLLCKPVKRADWRGCIAAAFDLTARVIDTPQLFVPAASEPRMRVLVVDDEPVNAAVAQGYLEALGCSSVWVSNGSDAVDHCATQRVDLVMMDLNMPVLDGFAATKIIRRNEAVGRRIPIIALTAHDATAYRDVCLAAGMDAVLSKPYTLDECSQILREFGTAGETAAQRVGEVSDSMLSFERLLPLATLDTASVAALKALPTRGNAPLYPRLVELFQKSSTVGIHELETALATEDWEKVRATCHRLAAAAANIGALAFSQEARLIETACSTGDIVTARLKTRILVAAHAVLSQSLDQSQLRESA